MRRPPKQPRPASRALRPPARVRRDPSDAEALYAWFDELARDEGTEAAVGALESFAERSKAATPSLVLGYCLFGAGRREEAVTQFRRAHARRPREATLYALSSGLLVTGRAEEALRLLQAAGRRRRLTARPLVSLADAYLALGRPADARRALGRISPRGRGDWKELVESADARVALALKRGRRATSGPRARARHARARSLRSRGDWAADAAGGALLKVHARPGAAASRVGRVDPWRGALEVEVQSRAEGGAANEELCKLLARALGVPSAAVTVEHGARSREKRVQVAGVSAAEAKRRLEGAR